MRRWLVGAAVALVALTACDAADPAPALTVTPPPSEIATGSGTGGGTLRWAIARPTAIVPTDAVDEAGLLIADTLFDSLTRVDSDGQVRPCAAVRWRSSNNGRRWRFTLRRGARFHDGTPVRAADVAASWSRTVAAGVTGFHLQDVAGYRAVRAGTATTLVGVRALDDQTLEVKLDRPNMDLPTVLAHPTLAPLPAAARTSRRFADQPIGNGPYRMVERWTTGQFIRVERDPAWRNGPQERSDERVREIVFRIIDPNAAYVAFQQQRIDVAPVPAGARQQAVRRYGSADDGRGPGVVDGPTPSLYYLAFDVTRPPWDDVEVRRAFSRAIDRAALAVGQRDVAVDPARWIVPPALPGNGTAFCDTCLYLPSLAAPAFETADVSEVTLTIDAAGGHEPIAERIRDDLAEVGVAVEIRVLPFEDFLAAVEAGEVALYRFGWQAQYASAGAMLEAVVRSTAPIERGDGANYGGYANPTVDRLLNRARRAEDRDRREALWTRAERIALEDQAIVPLFSFRQRIVISERIADLVVTPWSTATPERARIVAARRGPDLSGV